MEKRTTSSGNGQSPVMPRLPRTSHPAVKFLILAILLVVPSLIYFSVKYSSSEISPLPYLGPKEPRTMTKEGKVVTDTLYHTIPSFAFTDQNGQAVTEKTIAGKICVADFFFTRCPSICPKMSAQFRRIQDEFMDDSRLMLLSHSVDPSYDTVPVLKAYAEKYGALPAKWHLLTGEKRALYDLARQGYFLATEEGRGSPDDFIHSPMFILLDGERHIRGFYDGTNPGEVDNLLKDIRRLLAAKDDSR